MRIQKNWVIVLPIVMFALSLTACNNKAKETSGIQANQSQVIKVKEPFFKISLAEWSIHRKIRNEGFDPFLFAAYAKKNGFEGVEYVSALYSDKIKVLGFDKVIDSLNTMSKINKIQNVLIMVDREGDLSSPNVDKRNEAVQKHKKWVDAAEVLGCHSIRVNLQGYSNPENWIRSSVDGLLKLSDYAREKEVNIIVENHGGFSSNAALLAEVIHIVNKPNVGTLPDFGNFCLEKNEDKTCVKGKAYNRYQGVEEMMPFAKGVSAKSYDFDENGDETKIDYKRMIKIVRQFGYSGFIGVEYEGGRLSEDQGLLATRDLLVKVANSFN